MTRFENVHPVTILAAALAVLLFTAGCQINNPGDDDAPAETTSDGEASSAAGGEASSAAEVKSDEVELELWRSIKDSAHPEDFEIYLERYPEGAFAELASARLARLSEPEGAATSEPVAGEVRPDASSTTAAAAAPPPPPRRSRREVVESVLDRRLAGFIEPRLHRAPDIPRVKLDNAAAIHGFRPSEVLLLYDDGLKKGGKTGFCLTDRKLYWRFVSGSPPLSLELEYIENVQFRKKKFFVNGHEISVVMAMNPPYTADVFGRMLEEIGKEMRRR